MPGIPETLQFAIAHHKAGRLKEAEALYRAILKIEPRHADCHHLLGVIAYHHGRYAAALTLIAEAIDLNDRQPAYQGYLGMTLHALKRYDEAVAAFNRALAAAPDNLDIVNNLGNLYQDLGKLNETLDCRRRALALASDNPVLHYNYGVTLMKLGWIEQAIAAHQAALNLNPEFPECLNGLGEIYRKTGRLNKAIVYYQQALALRPGFASALNNLGVTYKTQGQLYEAATVFQQCLAIDPHYDIALSNLAGVLLALGRIDEAVEHYRQVIKLNPDPAEIHSNLIFAMTNLHNTTGATLLDESKRWDRRQARRIPIASTVFANSPDPKRRLRIGFVSADFRDHAVSYFLMPLFRNFDRSAFFIACYNETLIEDDVTGRFREHVECWRDSRTIHDAGLADMIRADAIDILVDCSGHSCGNRLPAFKRRCAPVQVSTPLGHGGTTGIAEMDYFFTDVHLTPRGHFSEELIRFERVFAPFEPKDFWPGPEMTVPNEIIFGCFGNPIRISAETLELWRRLLDAVPGARILFKNEAYIRPAMKQHWRNRFAALGDRAVFEGLPGGWDMNMDVYRRVRVVLDTFPSTGGTSSLIPLWMGVPVLTRAGSHTLQRFGVTILNNAGLPDLVAATDAEYLKTGAHLITDRERLKRLRAELRPRLRASALCDAAGVTREWEVALRRIWRRWCKEQTVSTPTYSRFTAPSDERKWLGKGDGPAEEKTHF